ncbi:MAG: TolC family protein, partial [Verrucomicrobiaceae bacterium]
TPQNPSLAASWRFTSPGGRSNSEFGLTQEILDLLLIAPRKKIAQHQLDQARLRVTREVTELNFDTREALINLQGEEQLLGRLRSVAEVQSTVADLAKRLHDAGNINDLEFKEQQNSSLELEFEIKKATAQTLHLREKLQRLMGVSETSWRVSPQLPELPGSDPSRGKLEELALSQRLDLAIVRSKAGQSEAALNLKKKTRRIPGLRLGVDTERDADGTHLTGPTADIEIPLFNRGHAEVAKLSAGSRQAAEEVAALEGDVRSQVREAHASLVAARSAAEFAKTKLLPNQQDILRETLLHYNAMQKSNFELLTAKEREVRAERNAVEALRDYWLARVALERAVGGRLCGGAKSAKP